MHALFQNPLLRLLGALWWLPALAMAIGWTLGEPILQWAIMASGAALALAAGMVGAGWAHGGLAAMRKRVQRRKARFRFLCPNCLSFGNIAYSCGKCSAPVESFLVETGGAYLNECPSCREVIFEEKGNEVRSDIRAYCRHCKCECEEAVYHHRQTQAWGVLNYEDIHQFCVKQPGEEKRIQGVRCRIVENGTTLTALIALEDLVHVVDTLPSSHALRHLEGIWMGNESVDALETGQILDAYFRVANLSPLQQKAPGAYLIQKDIPIDLKTVLQPRFHQVSTGIELPKLLDMLPDVEAGKVPVPVTQPSYSLPPAEAIEERIVSRE